MTLFLEKVPLKEHEVLISRESRNPQGDYPFHYHPEYELIMFIKGHGKRLVGDHLGDFTHGDLVLMGPNVPHQWRNDEVYRSGDKEVQVIVIHFRDNFLKQFLEMEEHAAVKNLLAESARGLFFPLDDPTYYAESFIRIHTTQGMERSLFFLTLLQDLSCFRERMTLLSPGYNAHISLSDLDGINGVLNYLMENYRHEVDLSVAATIVHMSKSGFSHYFKRKTGKTFSRFVNELRIGKVCRELMETEKQIAQICFENGFKNLSYFNRKFQEIKGVSPKEYRKLHLRVS